MEREELLKEAVKRYYTDPVFQTVVETAVMVTMSKVVISGKYDEVRETARLGASFALILNEQAQKLQDDRPVPPNPHRSGI